MKNIGLLLSALLMVACSPSTLEDLRCEGESQAKKLASELRMIEHQDALQKAVPRLKKRFNKLAEILVELRQFPIETSPPSQVSEELFAQLARLYEMPGGKELLESAQLEAVQILR